MYKILRSKLPYVSVRERAQDLQEAEADADDVIDLGVPREPRRMRARTSAAVPHPPPRHLYVPNPRLYPGQSAKPSPHVRIVRPQRRKRGLRRPVPNSRLYRPAPPRSPPPPARPRTSWPPPAPVRPLDTASHVALRLGEHRQVSCAADIPPSLQLRRSIAHSPVSDSSAPPPLHLVVTLPDTVAGSDSPAPSYRPTNRHFRTLADPGVSSTLRSSRVMMEVGGRRSPSPDRPADGHESPSAPSEFLAEFLSAIMRRQYAEALKYCRLILQYEPHNATARGFYPLLEHKVATHRPPSPVLPSTRGDGSRSSSVSEEAESSSHDSESEEERSSLELESEGSGTASATASGTASGELSARRTDTASCSPPPASDLEDTDDNGNTPLHHQHSPLHGDGDVENDNAGPGSRRSATHKSAGGSSGAGASGGEGPALSGLASLQRLRAQFTCSIK